MPIYRVPVDLNWSGSGSPGVNVWHVRTGGIDDDASVGAALAALGTFYTSVGVLLWQGTTWTIGEPVVDVDTDELLAVSPVTGGTSHGQSSRLAPALAIVCGWRTTLAARRGRGRTFLGPLNADAGSTDGTPSPGGLATIASAADALIATSSETNDWAFVVYGQQSAGIAGVKVGRDITSRAIRDQFAVLRSRRD